MYTRQQKQQKLNKIRSQFLKQRRLQIKTINTIQNKALKQKLTKFITHNDHQNFKILFLQSSPQFNYAYLFSQDIYLRTPIVKIFQQQSWYQFILCINQWSSNHYQFIRNSIEPIFDNQPLYHFLLLKFHDIVRVISQTPQCNQEKLVLALSQKNTLFSQLMIIFLIFLRTSQLLTIIPEQQQIRLILNIFCKISQNLQLLQITSQLKTLGQRKLKDKIWKQKIWKNYLSEPTLLTLSQLKYNFLHEITLKQDKKALYDILSKLDKAAPNPPSPYITQFDNSGQTPTDIILQKWQYSSITQFLKKYNKYKWIYFTNNCLNKIIINSKLNQQQIQSLINQCLNGQNIQRGFISQQFLSQLSKNNKKKIIQLPYIVIKQQQNLLLSKYKQYTYPLLTYLLRFQQNSSIKIIQKLFLKLLNPKILLTKITDLIKTPQPITQPIIQLPQILYYHQPLLHFISKLKTQALLQHFLNNLYINFTIPSKTLTNHYITNPHFIIMYITNSHDLSQNTINKKIIDQVFINNSQLTTNNFNMYIQLLKQLSNKQFITKRKDWLVLQLISKIKCYINSLKQQQFTQLFTYVNEDDKLNKGLLINLLRPLFSIQQISNFNILSKQQTDLYLYNNIKKIQTPYQKFEKKLSDMLKDDKQNQQYHHCYCLNIYQPQLQKKLIKLIQLGFYINFRVALTNQKFYEQCLMPLNQPYKTIVSHILKNNGRNHISIDFNFACLLCQKTKISMIKQFLLNSPPKLKKKIKQTLCDKAMKYFVINPDLLLQILQTKQLTDIYSIHQSNNQKSLQQNIKLALQKIIQSIEENIQLNICVDKLVIYRKIFLQFSKFKSNQQEKINNHLKKRISSIICRLSDKVNLSRFFKQITISQFLEFYNRSVFINALKYSSNPIQMLQNLSTQLNQLKITSPQKHYPHHNLFYDAYGIDDSIESLDKLFQIRKCKTKSKFWQIINNLSCQHFKKYLTYFPPKSVYQYKQYLINLQHQQKFLIILDALIQINSNLNQFLSSYTFVHKIQSLVQRKKDIFNAALCAFHYNKLRLHSESYPQNQILVSSQYHIDHCSNTVFQIYLKYFGHMLLLTNYDRNITQQNKIKIANKIIQYLFKSQNWIKLSQLFQKISIQRNKPQFKIVNQLQIISKKMKKQPPNQQQQQQIITKNHTDETIISSITQNFFQACKKSHKKFKSYQQQKSYEKMVSNLFNLFKYTQIPKNQQFFQIAWKVSPHQCLKLNSIQIISLRTAHRCLQQHPNQIALIKNIPINNDTLSQGNSLLLPIYSYNLHQFQQHPYFVDLFIYQLHLQLQFTKAGIKISNYKSTLQQKKSRIFLLKPIMQKYTHIYTQQQINKYSHQILYSKKINSIKQLPQDYVKALFNNSKKIKGFIQMKQSVIKQLIDLNYINKQHTLQIIKTYNMSAISYFITKTLIKINYALIKQLQNKHMKNTSFIKILLHAKNDQFATQFIKKYQIFDLYSNKNDFYSMTRDLLWQITFSQSNQILKLFLQHLSKKYKNGIKFAQAAFLNLPKQTVEQTNTLQQQEIKQYITQNLIDSRIQTNPKLSKQNYDFGVKNATVYLPLQIASNNNFYQYYFLLLQNSINKKQIFKSSHRFYSTCQPQQYTFIPLMKKRLNILKIICQFYSNYQNKYTLYQKVILPAIFSLNCQQIKASLYAQSSFFFYQMGQKKSSNKQLYYCQCSQQLYQFLSLLPNSQIKVNTQTNIFLIILLIKTSPTFQINQKQLQQQYSKQLTLINYILKNIKITVTGHQNINQFIKFNPYLRQLLFTQNPKYMLQNQKHQPLQDWALNYHHPFTINLPFFQQPQHKTFTQNFIHNCFFNPNISQPFDPDYNSKIMTDLLLCALISKYQGKSLVINKICQQANKTHDQLLLDSAIFISMFHQYQGRHYQRLIQKSSKKIVLKTLQSEMPINFNQQFWNELFVFVQQICQKYQFNTKSKFKPFFSNKYSNLLNYQLFKQKLAQLSKPFIDILACLSYLSNFLYIMNQLQDISNYFLQFYSQQKKKNIKLQIKPSSKFQLQTKSNLTIISIPICIINNQYFQSLKLDAYNIKQQINRYMLFNDTNIPPKQLQLLSKLTVKFCLQSFKTCTSIQHLKQILKTNTIWIIIQQQLVKLNQFLLKFKSTNPFSLNDIHGPIKINESTDKNKVIECINFYQFCKLPPYQVTVIYQNQPHQINSSFAIADIKQYTRYFSFEINDSQPKNTTPYKFNNIIYISPRKHQQILFQINYTQFFIYNILTIFQILQRSSQHICSLFNFQFVFKYSIISLINFFQHYLQSNPSSTTLPFLIKQFVNNKNNIQLIQFILSLAFYDSYTNIIKIVQGVVLLYTYNKNPSISSKCNPYQINSQLSLYSITYQKSSNILKIILQLGPINLSHSCHNVEQSALMGWDSLKNIIFPTTQQLTNHLLNISVINNGLMALSKQISSLANDIINFSINFSQLYTYIDAFKKTTSFKEIDQLLNSIKQQLLTKFPKYIQNTIQSKQLISTHKNSLYKNFTKFLSNPLKQQQKNQHYKQTKPLDLNPFTQIYNFPKFQHQQHNINIKNMFLIQIYKNSIHSILTIGMIFILISTSNQHLNQIIKIKQKQDLDLINFHLFNFILIITDKIPTNSEIQSSLIIRIFFTDFYQNFYLINPKVYHQLLKLPDNSEDRHLSYLAPLIQPNIILTFKSKYTKKSNQLKDDSNHAYFQLQLQKNNKFTFKKKQQIHITQMQQLKSNINFSKYLTNFLKTFQKYFTKNFTILLKLVLNTPIPLLKLIQIYNFYFLDFEILLKQLFTQQIIQKQFLFFLAIDKKKNISSHPIITFRILLFQSLFNTIQFQICDINKPQILIQHKKIHLILNITQSKYFNFYIVINTILQHLTKKFIQANIKHIQKYYTYSLKINHWSTMLNCMLMSHQQIQSIQKSFIVITKLKLQKHGVTKYKINLTQSQKTNIKINQTTLICTINITSSPTTFFSTSQIIQFFLNKKYIPYTNLTSTQHNPATNQLQFYNYDHEKSASLILISKTKGKLINIKLNQCKKKQNVITMPFNSQQYQSYYALQIINDITFVDHNYFWKIDQSISTITTKMTYGPINHKFSMILKHPSSINISQKKIHSTIRRHKQVLKLINIFSKSSYFDTQIFLLSKQIMIVQITPHVPLQIIIHLNQYHLLQKPQLKFLTLHTYSTNQMVLQHTKFIQLIYHQKKIQPLKIYQNQHDQQMNIINQLFKQPQQKMYHNQQHNQQLKKPNTQKLIYSVNKNSLKFITKAGQSRTDVIQANDQQFNPVKFKKDVIFQFKHANLSSEKITPTINYNGSQVQLTWAPTIRGPYHLFINQIFINPSYQIGVCASQFQRKSLKITPPKTTSICFCQQLQCFIQFVDSYGNIYTPLQQSIFSDQLKIDVQSPNIDISIKTNISKVDNYGKKSIKFSIFDSKNSSVLKLKIIISINKQSITDFELDLKGLNLTQRRKNLQNQIQQIKKRYTIEIKISRTNFLSDLFKLAQNHNNLQKKLSVEFLQQKGIDAGGLKREFYDLIGKQLKNPTNGFFIQTDRKRHNQYFINSQIFSSKKKKQYMTLFGQFLANSFINWYMIGINFSTTFIKLLYQQPITFEDMLSVISKQQSDSYKSLQTSTSQYINDLQLYFSQILNPNKMQQIQMIPNGKTIKVTKQNIKQYLQLLPKFKIQQRYQQIIKFFRDGFNSVLQLDLIKKWISPQQFYCLTTGVKKITPQIILQYINMQGQQTLQTWFRKYIMQQNLQTLQHFLKFSTGSSSIDFQLSSKIHVKFLKLQKKNPNAFPIAHTCYKTIQIPAYQKYSIMKQKLDIVFNNFSQGFGFS